MVTKNFFSSKSSNKSELHPWFVTGYTDGEGSFSIRMRKKFNSSLGYQVSLVYSIVAEQNPLNLILLEKVKEYFKGEGSITKSANMYSYEISAVNSLNIVKEHFENYPLQTTKSLHFKLWCEVLEIIKKKEHLTEEGFIKILTIKAVFPRGLSSSLFEFYPNIVPINKPVFVPSEEKLDPNWIVGFTQADGTFGLNYIKQSRIKLGYTLGICGLNYKIYAPIKVQSQLRKFSSKRDNELHPWFITGFTDGEGSFFISITKNNNLKLGWRVQTGFAIELHEKDMVLLEKIKAFFNGVRDISIPREGIVRYRVRSLKELQIIINHFDNYPLISQKKADYDLLKQVYFMLNKKEHLIIENFNKILSIKDSINKGGLSEELKKAYPDYIPAYRPLITNSKIKNPNRLAGFTAAEGCFLINLMKSDTHKLKERVNLKFNITQHLRDEELISSFVEYLDCKNVYKQGEIVDFWVSKFEDIINKIIPFFEKYPLEGVKYKDFEDFRTVAYLMKNKAHLTFDGLEQIKKIKAGMNKGRIFDKDSSEKEKNLFNLSNNTQKRTYCSLIRQPQFRITQHERDLIVLNRIIESMGCGTIVKPGEGRDRYTISVANLKDLTEIVIPLFETHPIYVAKFADFLDFCVGLYLIKMKAHLTLEGLKKLHDLAKGMNTGRKF
jgi:hypothetical protein